VNSDLEIVGFNHQRMQLCRQNIFWDNFCPTQKPFFVSIKVSVPTQIMVCWLRVEILDHKIFFRVYVFVATFLGFRPRGPEKIFTFWQKDTKKFFDDFFSQGEYYGILCSL